MIDQRRDARHRERVTQQGVPLLTSHASRERKVARKRVHPRDFSLGEVPQPHAALRALARPARNRPVPRILVHQFIRNHRPRALDVLAVRFREAVTLVRSGADDVDGAQPDSHVPLGNRVLPEHVSRTVVHVSRTVLVVSGSVEKRPDEGDGVPVQGVIGGVRFSRRVVTLPPSPVPRVKLRLGVALELGG